MNPHLIFMSWGISRIYNSWHISKTHRPVIYTAEKSDQLSKCTISNPVHLIKYINKVHKKFIISYYNRFGYFSNRCHGNVHKQNVKSVIKSSKIF